MHYEGELAVVIGRICRDVPRERVTDVILGYTFANDVTARDLQQSDVQWTRAKGFDTVLPARPVDRDRPRPRRRRRPRRQRTVNGELRQDGRTSDMIFAIADLIVHITEVMTLLPGDVILTGTPAGVGPHAASATRSRSPSKASAL